MKAPLISVCFVCLGNICRSPTAEGVFRRKVKDRGWEHLVAVDSAGTAAYHEGEQADRRSRAVAHRRGYDLDSIARQFKKEDLDRFDYVLAMDAQNLVDLQRLVVQGHNPKARLALLRDFDPSAPQGSSVPDPYYGGARGFDEVLEQCERACDGLLDHLAPGISGRA